MEHDGHTYTRIWQQSQPEKGKAGGAFTMDLASIQELAGRSTSIHMRLAGQPEQSATLAKGQTWPLERLRQGMAFHRTLSGGGVSRELAAETWTGSLAGSMWNTSAESDPDLSLADGLLYASSTKKNAAGLNLLAGKACGVDGTEAAAVEVWLGVLTPKRETRQAERRAEGGGYVVREVEVPKEEIAIREVPVDREVIREVEREVVKTEILEVPVSHDVVVEVIREVEKIIYQEVKVEVPVEVIKEVPKIIEKEVIKIVEVIKEVPIETIRTVEKIVPQVVEKIVIKEVEVRACKRVSE